MLITRQDILLQNQLDEAAFQRFSVAMRELLISEMEASRKSRRELQSSIDQTRQVINQAA